MGVWQLGLAALAGASIAGCQLLLGYDGHLFEGSGGSSSSSGTGVAGGTPGDGGPDGDGGPVLGKTQWAVSFGDVNDQTVNAVAVVGGQHGQIYLTGRGNGFTSFGCKTTVDVDGGGGAGGGGAVGTSGTGYLVELDPTGACTWAFFFGDDAEGTAVAVDSAGDVILGGKFKGSISLPTSTSVWNVPAGSGQDSFVMRFNGPLHAVDWVRVLTDDTATGDQVVTSVAANPGKAFVSVQFDGSLAILEPPGGMAKATLQGMADAKDSMVLLLDTTGAVANKLDIRSGTTTEDQLANGVDVRSDGVFAVTGATTGATIINNLPVTAPVTKSVFLAAYAEDKTPQFQSIFPGTMAQAGKRVAFSSAGQAFLAGEFLGTIAFADGGPSLNDTGYTNVFVASFDDGGTPESAIRLGSDDSTAHAGVNGLAVDDANHTVVFGGSFVGKAGFPDDTPLTGAGMSNIYVAKVDTALSKPIWLKSFSGPDVDTMADNGVDGVGVDGEGNTILVGHFTKKLDFGDGTAVLAGNGKHDIFVAKLAP